MGYKAKYNRRGKNINVYTTYYNQSDDGRREYDLRSSPTGKITPGEMFALGGWESDYGAYRVGYLHGGHGWSYGYIKSDYGLRGAFTGYTSNQSYRRNGMTYSVFTLRKSANLYAAGHKWLTFYAGAQVWMKPGGDGRLWYEKPWRVEIHGYRRSGAKWTDLTYRSPDFYLDTGWKEGMVTRSSCRIKTYR